MSLPSYVMKKHLTALNKIIRKEHTIKGISKMKKDEVARLFNDLFEMKNNEPVLKTSKSKMALDIKDISKLTLPVYKKYISKRRAAKVDKIPKEHKKHHTKKHINIMENEMKKGKSFKEAHKKAVKEDKKAPVKKQETKKQQTKPKPKPVKKTPVKKQETKKQRPKMLLEQIKKRAKQKRSRGSMLIKGDTDQQQRRQYLCIVEVTNLIDIVTEQMEKRRTKDNIKYMKTAPEKIKESLYTTHYDSKRPTKVRCADYIPKSLENIALEKIKECEAWNKGKKAYENYLKNNMKKMMELLRKYKGTRIRSMQRSKSDGYFGKEHFMLLESKVKDMKKKQETKKQETKPKPKPANKIKDQKNIDDTKSLMRQVKREYDSAVKKMKEISKKIRKTDKLSADDYKYLKIIPKYGKENEKQRIKRLKKIIKKYKRAPREFKKNI